MPDCLGGSSGIGVGDSVSFGVSVAVMVWRWMAWMMEGLTCLQFSEVGVKL